MYLTCFVRLIIAAFILFCTVYNAHAQSHPPEIPSSPMQMGKYDATGSLVDKYERGERAKRTSMKKEDYSVAFVILDDESGEALLGATVFIEDLQKGSTSDENGISRFEGLPQGTFTFVFQHVGYETVTIELEIPKTVGQSGTRAAPIEIRLHHEHEHLEEITVSITRTTRTIQDTPTRVVAITSEEIGEKGNMRPGDIRMILAESTGIQVQQTSAVTGSSMFRIQGLDGRYTQLMKDGFPLYSGFSGGLSIMQIPPLDLRQVELVKGSNSTLYGGGAIAGVVNLMSKRPSEEQEISWMGNVSTSNGLDFSGFYSGLMVGGTSRKDDEAYGSAAPGSVSDSVSDGVADGVAEHVADSAEKTSTSQKGRIGLTMYVAYNENSGYDPSDQGFSAVPKYERFTWNPKIFWTLQPATEITAGLQLSLEERTGGDMAYLRNDADDGTDASGGVYYEEHQTERMSTQLSLRHRVSDKTELHVKNSVTFFDRTIDLPDYAFDGSQTASFSEVMVAHESNAGSWVGGINLWTDRFERRDPAFEASADGAAGDAGDADGDVQMTTAGIFLQNSAPWTDKLSVESGLRLDVSDPAADSRQWFVLPRISALYRINAAWSLRFGGGLGYKLPDMFTDEAENRAFRKILPPDLEQVKTERSAGLNADVNVRTILAGDLVLRVNQLFYATRLENPLTLSGTADPDGFFRFGNLDGTVRSRGTETNAALLLDPFKLFLGYTFVDARRLEGDKSTQVPLNSPHQGSAVLMIEEHGAYRLGLEAYYYSSQKRSGDEAGNGYTIFGVMGEKTWGRFTVFLNVENIFDTRQTRFETIFTGGREQPTFRDIYAPLEGRYINAGVKVQL